MTFKVRIRWLKELSPDSNDLAERHLDLPELRDEDCGDGLVKRRAIHVDGGADGDDEARDARVQTHVVAATNRYGHRRWAGNETWEV